MAAHEPNEKEMARVLRAFVTTIEGTDFGWIAAWYALGHKDVTKIERRAIRDLRDRGYLMIGRGGMDEMGDICGGSGYWPTVTGKSWLAELDAQQELPL